MLWGLHQFPRKRTTRKFLKVLRSNTFKNFLGLDLGAKRCKYLCRIKITPTRKVAPRRGATLRVGVCN